MIQDFIDKNFYRLLMFTLIFGVVFYGTIGTYVSGVYYSSVYTRYDMDGILELAKNNYLFVADTVITHNRVFYMMMLLGFLFSDLRKAKLKQLN